MYLAVVVCDLHYSLMRNISESIARCDNANFTHIFYEEFFLVRKLISSTSFFTYLFTFMVTICLRAINSPFPGKYN